MKKFPSSPLRRSYVELPHKGGSHERGAASRRIEADLIRPVCELDTFPIVGKAWRWTSVWHFYTAYFTSRNPVGAIAHAKTEHRQTVEKFWKFRIIPKRKHALPQKSRDRHP